MSITNIKFRSRSQSLDIGGKLFIKGKLQFRFIKKWVEMSDNNILKIKKRYPAIFTVFQRRQLLRTYKFQLKRVKRFLRYRFRRFKRVKQIRLQRKYLNRFRLKTLKFNILDYDLDLEFLNYYSKFRYKNVLKFRIHYDSFPKRIKRYKRLYIKKQRLKTFLNFKDYQFKNYIKTLKTKKFYLFDFLYFLEYRIDTLLYRIFFFQNFKIVRQFINNYGVYINKKYITNYHYLTRIGDIIQLSKNYKSLKMLMYLLNQLILVPFPKYFEVNYNTLTVVVKSFFLFKTEGVMKNQSEYFNRKKKKTDNIKLPFPKRPFYPRLNKENRKKLGYFNFLIQRRKRYNMIYKNKLYFAASYELGQLYYPFNLNFEDLNSIFQYY